jgi:hypothetical protein
MEQKTPSRRLIPAQTDVDFEVRRALGRKIAESPYLVRQLSAFDDRQLVTGLPGTIVQGASVYVELDGKRRDNDLYWFGLPK